MINVLFNMDGALIDSASAISSAVNEVRAELELSPLKREDMMHIINTPQTDWAKELYKMKNFNHSSFKEGFEEYFIKRYQQSAILFEGTKGILDFLKEQKCYLAIVANALQSSLTQVLNKHNILLYSDKILGASVGIEPKPSPTIFRSLKEEAPYQTNLFIGDSARDEEAAQRVSVPHCHTKWYEKDLKEDGFSSAKELLNLSKGHL